MPAVTSCIRGVCLPSSCYRSWSLTARTFLNYMGQWLGHHKAALSVSNPPAGVYIPSLWACWESKAGPCGREAHGRSCGVLVWHGHCLELEQSGCGDRAGGGQEPDCVGLSPWGSLCQSASRPPGRPLLASEACSPSHLCCASGRWLLHICGHELERNQLWLEKQPGLQAVAVLPSGWGLGQAGTTRVSL